MIVRTRGTARVHLRKTETVFVGVHKPPANVIVFLATEVATTHNSTPVYRAINVKTRAEWFIARRWRGKAIVAKTPEEVVITARLVWRFDDPAADAIPASWRRWVGGSLEDHSADAMAYASVQPMEGEIGIVENVRFIPNVDGYTLDIETNEP